MCGCPAYSSVGSRHLKRVPQESDAPLTTVTLQMPDEVLAVLREEPVRFGAELRLAAAMNWYRRGTVSQEVAAQVAGLDRTDFLLALARHGEDVFKVDLADLRREIGDD